MRKLIDDKGRIFGLISFIDIVVFLVAAILVLAFFVKFNVIYTPVTASTNANVSYTVRVPTARHTAANLLRPGDRLYSRDHGGAYMGTITAVHVTYAYATEPLADGTFVRGRVHDRYDVTLTIEVEGTTSGGRLFANRVVELNANADYRLFTKYNDFSGTLLTIDGGR